MVGRTLGHYRIEAKLGEGGMGVVYRARDLNLNRNVAIKFLSSDIADEEHRRRFQQEAQTASALNHPNILTIFETGAIDGQQYLVTEFIDGYTLGEWARREQPSLRHVVELSIGIADALACAHQAGILHRDVKPENILVAKAGYAKLVDFGLAKLLEGAGARPDESRTVSVGPTRPGVIVGTVAYMSPEQAAGKPVDARSDIFSFGVVLYELLAGRRPFTGESDLLVLQAILHSSPSPLADLRPDCPFELCSIAEKALEKDPNDRYQSMREVVVDLRRAQRSKTSKTAAVVAPARRRRTWILVAAAALLVAAMAVTGWRLHRSDYFWQNPLANAQYTRLTDFESTELDAAISPDGKLAAFLSDRDGQYDIWVTQVGSGEFVNLTKGRFVGLASRVERTIGFSSDGTQIWFRVKDDAWVMPSMGGAPRPFLSKAAIAVWSPDGNRIVYHTTDPGDPVFLTDGSGRNPKQISIDKPGVHDHYQTWSPDSRLIYFVRGNLPSELDIWRMPSSGAEPERITHHDSRVAYPTLLDNRTLIYSATAEDGSGPWLYATDVGRRIAHRVSSGLEQYTSVAGALDRRRLVATVANPSANLWTAPVADDVVEETAVKPFHTPTVRALSPRFGSDYVLYLSSRGRADGLWKFKDGSATELWKGSEGALDDSGALSPDRRQICFSARKQGRSRLHLMNADGTSVRPLAESLEVRGAASWSPDGKQLVVSANDGKGFRLFQVPVEDGQPISLSDSPCNNPVWSPDGRLILYSQPVGGTSERVHAITPQMKPFPLPEMRVTAAGERYRFLPDGKKVVLYLRRDQTSNFWLLEFETGRLRQLTNLHQGFTSRSFDLSPDGKQILFDRMRENSDVVLIDLK